MTVIVDITDEGHVFLNGQRALQQPKLAESLAALIASKIGMQLSCKSLLRTFQHDSLDKAPRLC